MNFLHTMVPDKDGFTSAAFVNRGLGLGLGLRFTAGTLPYLSEWKMLADVDYVVGIEPVNAKIANRAALRAEGKLPTLSPGETRDMEVQVSVLEGAAEIDSFCAQAQKIQGGRS